MKKLLALLLSVVMAVSLAAPAFAAPGDDTLADPGPSAWGEDWDFNWTVEEEWNAVCEEYPERVDIFLEEVEAWYAEHAGEYDWCDAGSFEEFVENMGGEEAACLSLFYEWNRLYEEELARNELFAALGGVPGQVGVMVNGKYIQFPDAVPEVNKGRTMVPVRALVETLGGEVDYYAGAVEFILDGFVYEFAIGSPVVKVRPAQASGKDMPQPDSIAMDCAPYIKDNRTYVPIRFISEALGYEVGWDSEFRTAILVDRAALAAEIDQDFTILNRVQAAAAVPVEDGQSRSMEMEGSLTFTAFDTLDGDQTYTVDLTGKALVDAGAANGACSITMSDDTVDALIGLLMGGEGPEAAEAAEALRAVLGGLEDMEVIMTREGLAWVHAPILDEQAGVENVWYSYDMGAGLAQAIFTGTDTATVGTAIAGTMSTDSIIPWAGMDEAIQAVAGLFGDDQFTTADGVSTVTIGADTLDPDGMLGVKDVCKEFELTIEVDSEGGAVVACRMETEAQSGIPAMKLAMDCTQSGGKASLTLELHIANLGELKLALTAIQQAAGEKPMTEPPEGAVVIEHPELPNP